MTARKSKAKKPAPPCGVKHRFKPVPQAGIHRAAIVACSRPQGHEGSHETTRGGTAFCWSPAVCSP